MSSNFITNSFVLMQPKNWAVYPRMMPIKKRKGSLGADDRKEEAEEPIQQPPSAKRRKKSVIQYDPVSSFLGQFINLIYNNNKC